MAVSPSRPRRRPARPLASRGSTAPAGDHVWHDDGDTQQWVPLEPTRVVQRRSTTTPTTAAFPSTSVAQASGNGSSRRRIRTRPLERRRIRRHLYVRSPAGPATTNHHHRRHAAACHRGRIARAGGSYTLSWTGTAQGRVGAGSYAASPVTVTGITAGANTTIEFNTGTLEPGAV